MTEGGADPDLFGSRAVAWAAWQGSPWGRMRYAVVRRTTARALAELPGPLRILDAGGGDGADSIPLAAEGHSVTVLDFAPELLDQARRAAEALGVRDRVQLLPADLDAVVGAELADVRFDAVLCHNVLQYRADVPATVRLLTGLVRPGGVLSVLAPNPAMDVLSAAVRRLDLLGAGQLLDSPTVHGETFDHDMRRLQADEVEAALVDAGCEVQYRFGIRCLIDLIADDQRKADPDFYARLLELELRLCEREPYWRTARFWQLSARRIGQGVHRSPGADGKMAP